MKVVEVISECSDPLSCIHIETLILMIVNWLLLSDFWWQCVCVVHQLIHNRFSEITSDWSFPPFSRQFDRRPAKACTSCALVVDQMDTLATSTWYRFLPISSLVWMMLTRWNRLGKWYVQTQCESLWPSVVWACSVTFNVDAKDVAGIIIRSCFSTKKYTCGVWHCFWAKSSYQGPWRCWINKLS